MKPLPVLRIIAHRACVALSEELDVHPDALWSDACKGKFPESNTYNQNMVDFKEAFDELHTAEKSLI